MSLALRKSLILGIFLAFSAQANAMSPGSVHDEFMNPQEQIVLTSAKITKVVAVLPKLIALTKNYQGTHSAGPGKKNVKNVKYEAFANSLKDLSGKHGFKDMKTMQRTVETTMLTAGFIKSGKTLKQVQEQIAATQKRIESNKKITVKQRSSLLRRMHIQISMVVPSPENINTVKPFFERIVAITGKK